MSLRLVAAAVLAVAVSGPALACKGPTLIFSDDFKTVDPSWVQDAGTLKIAGGKLTLTAPAGNYASTDYEGFFVNSGDACVDVAYPSVKDPSQGGVAGIMFGYTDYNDFYAFVVRGDGQAGIFRLQNGGWLTPVPLRAAQGLKTGPNAVNTFRVTWKNTDGAAYINDQLFINFKIQPFSNGTFGIYSEPEGNTYTFSNVKVTNVP